MAGLTIPGGREKGATLAEASDEALNYWIGRIEKDLEANPGKQYADRDRALVDAMVEEMTRRDGRGGDAPPAAPRSEPRAAPAPQAAPPGRQQSIQRAPRTQLVGMSLNNAEAVTATLREYAAQTHLVSPATSCGQLPEGCEVAISLVHVDVSDAAKEVYPTSGGRVGLAKVVLNRIESAAAISWDPMLSCRIDDGRDPRYVHYRAVGYARNLDGSVRTITGEKEMDLRDGSPQIEALYERAKGTKSDGSDRKDPTLQIREIRLHILSHAETKAKERATRSLGVKTSYTKDELQRPFAVARLMWTGRTNDPELRRAFAMKQADAMIGGTAALYGAQQPRQLSGHTPHAPPPVGSVPADDEAYEVDATGTDDDRGY